MSNYLSQEYRIQAPQSSVDLNVVDKALTTVQGKYDANKSAIDQAMTLYNTQLKGLRESDNEYIAARLTEVKNTIDQYSVKNGNLAMGTNKDSILSAINSITSDPIIQDAMTSAHNAQDIQNQYQEVLKKNPELASQTNYKDALDQAGYSDYMAGKSKKLGKMTYVNYTDVVGNMDKRAKEYAKDFGLQERYLGSDKSNPYYYEDKYGKVITKEEVYKYLEGTLSQKDREQLQIDTRQSLGKYTDEQYTEFSKEYYGNEKKNLSSELAQLKAQQATDPDKNKYKEIIADYTQKISDFDVKSNKTSVDRSDMYSIYSKTAVGNVASNYDISIITKIDRDKLPFEVMKFQTDTELKIQGLKLKAEANRIASEKNKKDAAAADNSGNGTPIALPTPAEEKDSTDLENIQRETARTASALDNYLMEYQEGYSSMTNDEKWNFKLHYNPNDLTAKGNSATAKVLAKEFKVAQKAYATTVSKAEDHVLRQVSQSFNDLSGGKANLENLAATMPLTVSVLKGSKGINFQSLPEVTRKGLLVEWTKNKLQYGAPASKDVKRVYENIVVKNKAALGKVGGDAKSILKAIDSTGSSNEVGNVFVNIAKIAGKFTKNAVLDPIADTASEAIARVFSGEAVANELRAEHQRVAAQDSEDMYKIDSDIRRGARDMGFSEDTNITELDARDLAVRNGKTSLDVGDAFYALDKTVAEQIKKTALSYQPNIKDYKAFNFSTTVKEQKNTAAQLRALVLNKEGAAVPASSNDYTVSREGTAIRISYLNEDSEKTSALIDKVDPSLLTMIDRRKVNWLNDPKNPNIDLEPLTFSPIENTSVSINKIKNLVENIQGQGLISAEAAQGLLRDPANSPFASVKDYRDRVIALKGKAFYEKNADKIEKILTTPYTSQPYSDGASINTQIIYKDNGEYISTVVPLNMSENNDATLYLNSLTSVDEIKMQRINKL